MTDDIMRPRQLTETEEFVMLLCQAVWGVGGSDSDRLCKVQDLLCVYSESHPLPPLPDDPGEQD